MTDHTCRTLDPACYRCDISVDGIESAAYEARADADEFNAAALLLSRAERDFSMTCGFLWAEAVGSRRDAAKMTRQVADYRARQQKARGVTS